MPGWTSSSVADQRRRFLESSRTRIIEACEDLKVLRNQPWQTSFLRSIARICHQLSGSSGFFDLPQFSRAAGGCERIALELLRKSSDLAATDVDLLEQHLLALSTVLDQCDIPETIEQATPQQAPQEHLVLVCADPRTSIKATAALEKVPYTLHVYRTADAAMAHLLNEGAGALVVVGASSDTAMSQLICEFRKKYENKPILFLSQNDNFLDRLNLIRIGVDGFFEAPFDFEAIVHRLSELASRDATFLYRVLSVEDDPIQSEIIASTLQSAGYAVVSLLEHRGFEEAVISFKPDLILMDVDLGEVSGFDLARYIRKMDHLASIPIVFLTTRNQLDSFTEGARSGGDEYLVKPASTQYLIATITARIERYRAMQKLVERDGLTRLYTYSHFLTRSQQVITDGCNGWMVCFDVDGLGEINNTLGLAAGDRAIAGAAKIIRSVFRQTELLGRTAGGELSLLVRDIDEKMLLEVCQFVTQQAASAEVFPSDSSVALGLSAGIAPLDGVADATAALVRARSALKIAKQCGRSSVVRLPAEVSQTI